MNAGLHAIILVILAAPAQAQAPPPIQGYLNDPHFAWRCQRQGTFQFCWEATLDQDAYMRAARESAEASRETVLRAVGLPRYDQPVYVFFVASVERMYQLIGYRGEGRSRPAQHAIFFVPTPIRPELTHELCHEILTNVWGVAESWIEEGFASLLAEGTATIEMNCRSLLIQRKLLPINRLVEPEWNPSKYPSDVTYRELAGFVRFLWQRYGLDRVKQIWRLGSGSIGRIVRKPLPELEREWLLELKHENAV